MNNENRIEKCAAQIVHSCVQNWMFIITEPKSGVIMLNTNEQLPTMWVALFNAVFINHDEQVDNFCCVYLGHHPFLQVG